MLKVAKMLPVALLVTPTNEIGKFAVGCGTDNQMIKAAPNKRMPTIEPSKRFFDLTRVIERSLRSRLPLAAR